MMKMTGVVLILLGLIGVLYGGFTFKTKETLVDGGPIQVTRDKSHTIPLPPVVGAISLAAGILLVVVGWKK